MNEQRYYFAQDEDSHWFLIPAEKMQRFNMLMDKCGESGEWEEFCKEFDEHRLNGGMEGYSFTNPKLEWW